jgi:hypothetical protein
VLCFALIRQFAFAPDPHTIAAHCEKRRAEFAKSGRLPRLAAFPVLSESKRAFKAEGTWKDELKNREYKVTKSLTDATFIISKQQNFARLPGQQLCTDTQFFNHIPGQGAMVDKFKLVRLLADYKEHHPSFDLDGFAPRTYLVTERDHCEEFMGVVEKDAELNDGKQPVQWIQKMRGKENGKGITLLAKTDTDVMLQRYKSGRTCPSAIMQRYIHDPLLINGHKCDFRVYAFVATTAPFHAYFHPRFYMKCSPEPYSPLSTDKAGALSNQQQMKKKKGVNQNDYIWDTAQLQDYLVKNKIAAADWVETKLRPMMKQKLAHVLRAARPKMEKEAGYFAVYGADMMLDSQLNLWLIEVNFSPGLYLTSEVRTVITKKV